MKKACWGKTLLRLFTVTMIGIMLFLSIDIPNADHVYAAEEVRKIQIAAGGNHNILLKADGTVWTWGINSYGQLGDGTTIPNATITKVNGLSNIKAIAASYDRSMVLKGDGTVWSWGYNNYGQLGNGNTNTYYTPVQVSGLNNVKAIALGYYHSMALKEDGTVWTWGYNNYGQLGNGNTNTYSAPVQVSNLRDVVAISAGQNHSLALKSDGTVWAWGYNGHGELGNATTTNSYTAVQVSSLSDVKNISSGIYHNIAVKNDGTVWTWGYNNEGELGDGTNANRTTPTQVLSLANIEKAVAGYYFSSAVTKDGVVFTWGQNTSGQLGDGTITNSNIPKQISSISNISELACGGAHILALNKGGALYAWGAASNGQLANADYFRKLPKKADALNDVKTLSIGGSHGLVLENSGAFKVWGVNSNGQFGNGLTSSMISSIPTAISSLTNVKEISAGGSNSFIVKGDGTVWGWGYNGNYELGIGNNNAYYSPVQTSITNVKSIAAGGSHTIALRNDGIVWAWGNGNNYQIGNGGSGLYYSPAQVSSISSITSISAGSNHSIALRSDGTVWAWGYNGNGELGAGGSGTYYYPNQVSGLSGITKISTSSSASHSLALKSNGTVWAWGVNSYGQLGMGSTNATYSPVQVSNLTNVKSIAVGSNHSLALKQDGTVWSWGYNASGQLGDDTYTNRLAPVQVKGLENIVEIYAGSSSSYAVKQDGTVYSWGNNASGQLADGVRSSYVTTPLRLQIQLLEITSAVLDKVEDTKVTASWTTSIDSGEITYRLVAIDSEGVEVADSGWIGDKTYTLTGLNQLASYVIKVKAKDSTGYETDWYQIGQTSTTMQIPALTVKNTTPSYIDLAVSDTLPSATQYQITCGNLYVAESGRLTVSEAWISIPSKQIRVTGLAADTTYAFRIKARNADFSESALSELLLAKTVEGSIAIPGEMTHIATYKQVTLSWEPVEDATGYELEANGSTIATLDSTDLSYVHSNLLPNTTYRYRLRGLKGESHGDWSEEHIVKTLVAPPTTPTAVTLTPTNTAVTVKWGNVAGAESYEIEADGTVINVGKSVLYKHVGLSPNTLHVYRVRAINVSGISSWSTLSAVDTTDKVPTAPKEIKTFVTKSDMSIAWENVVDADKYEIEENGVLIDNGTGTYFIKKGLSPDTQRTFRIRGVNNMGKGAWSQQITLETYLLSTPVNITTTESENSVILSWEAIQGAQKYEVMADGHVIDVGNNTTYSHTNLDIESEHDYKVRAISTAGTSSWTNVVEVTTLPEKPNQPTNISATASQNMITITWSAVEGADGYDVILDGVLIDNGKNTAYIHKGLKSDTPHTYKIRAKTFAREGDFTTSLVVKTLPEKPKAPQNIQLASSATIATVTWDKVVGALSYEIEVNGQVINVGTKTTYTHRRAMPNLQHEYRVRTVSSMGTSEWSGKILNNTLVAPCIIDQTVDLGLTAVDIVDFSKYKLTLTYDPNVMEVLDLSTLSPELELSVGRIIGTEITVTEFENGKITFVVDKAVTPGEAWSGLINSIKFKGKVDGGTAIMYTVYENTDGKK